MTNNEIRTYNSGIHLEPFFIKYKHLYQQNNFYENVYFDKATINARTEEVKKDYDYRTLEGFINDLDQVDYYNKEEMIEHAEEQYQEYLEEHRDEIEEQIRNNLDEAIGLHTVYFKPLIFNIDIAVKCDLIPFTYNDIQEDMDDYVYLLALGGCGMDMSPKLEAYQALADKTVDPNSKLYKILQGNLRDCDYWTNVVSQEVLEEIKILFGSADGDIK